MKDLAMDAYLGVFKNFQDNCPREHLWVAAGFLCILLNFFSFSKMGF